MLDVIDRKFQFSAYNVHTGKRVTEENGIVFKASDDCLIPTLEFYKKELILRRATTEQVAAVGMMIDRVRAWRAANPNECKVPDVTREEAEALLK